MNTLKSINNYIARQKGWIKANNLKKGDLVLVIKVHESSSKGWDNGWNRIMNRDINKVLSVIGIYNDGIKLKGNQEFNFVYPYTVLRKIEVKKEGDTPEKGDIVYLRNQLCCRQVSDVYTNSLSSICVNTITKNSSTSIATSNWRFATKEEVINFYNNK